MIAAFAFLLLALPAVAFAQAGPPASTADWPSYNRTPEGTRFSPLAQITTSNVAQLRPVCTYETGETVSFQTSPLVIDGTMYFTSDTMTYAMDAATCAPRWKQRTPYPPTGLTVNRGAAYADGRLFRGTGATSAMALDAATGRTLWDVPIGAVRPGETAPMAPIAWNGMVFIGNAGGDNRSVTGRVLALDQEDGSTIWQFDVVPDSGAVRQTWGNLPGIPPTGGAFWTSYGLDAERGVLYVPAGNPAPDFIPEVRPGKNLFTNSVIALDAESGRLLGYYQVVKYDTHDWDVSTPPVVLTTRAGRAIVASANKDGLLSVLDGSGIGVHDVTIGPRAPLPSGQVLELLYQVPTTTRENTDLHLTRHREVRFCPGSQGGSEWNGAAYHPELNLLFVGAVDWCYSVQPIPPDSLSGEPGTAWGGGEGGGFGKPDSAGNWRGWITAVDADSGSVRWKHQTSMPMLAGLTPTAGGLVFTGELSGDAIALDAATGEVLWRHSTGNAIGGGVITYEVDGRQYVAVAAGMKSPIWPVPNESNRIIVYGLP